LQRGNVKILPLVGFPCRANGQAGLIVRIHLLDWNLTYNFYFITIMPSKPLSNTQHWEGTTLLQRRITGLETNIKWLQKCLTEEKLCRRPCLESVSNLQGYIERDLCELRDLLELTCPHCGKSFYRVDETMFAT